MGRLDGKVCIITGAGSGMGAAATSLFCREGASVVAADLDPGTERALFESCRDLPGQLAFVVADVSTESGCKTLTETALARFGRLNVLYNNAGVMPTEDNSILETPSETWDHVLAVNLSSVRLCCKHAIPALIEGGGGSIINIASFVAFMGCSVPQDAYTASKGAVVSLTRSLAVQFGPNGIRTNCICPGPIETPLMENLIEDPAGRATRLARIPMGRFGRADDVTYLALHLASDESSWTNGAALVVDGGISCNYF
jgi:NAD(P)-dependent dehydrogenase (short-subunit alcohol dehydrogenase family)